MNQNKTIPASELSLRQIEELLTGALQTYWPVNLILSLANACENRMTGLGEAKTPEEFEDIKRLREAAQGLKKLEQELP